MRFDDNFFEKNQKLLLKLSRSRWTNWILGLNRLPKKLNKKKLLKITSNSIHWLNRVDNDGLIHFDGAFFTAPRFAEALAYNLSPFVYFQTKNIVKWQFSPVGVLGMIATILMPKIGFLGVIGTVTDFSVGSGDGYVTLTGLANNSYSTWRDAANGSGSSTTTTDGNDGNQAGSPYIAIDGNGRYTGSRAFFPTDTSGLGSSASISSASLFLCSDSWASRVTYADNNVEVTESTVTSDTALANADFNNWGSTKLATGIAHSALAASGSFNEFVLNASGLSLISKTGFTKHCVRFAYDVDNSAPGTAASSRIVASFRFSDYTGTSSDPYLRITYTVSQTTSNPQGNLLLMGAG